MKPTDNPMCPCCAREVALDLLARQADEAREWKQRYRDAEMQLRYVLRRTPRGWWQRLRWVLFGDGLLRHNSIVR